MHAACVGLDQADMHRMRVITQCESCVGVYERGLAVWSWQCAAEMGAAMQT